MNYNYKNRNYKMKKNIFCFILLIIFIFPIICYCKPYRITFVWDANNEPDIRGYKLYQKRYTSIDYSSDPVATILVEELDPNNIEYTLETDINVKNDFVVTAFDYSDNESDYSNEVSFTPDVLQPNSPTGFGIKKIEVIIDVEF